MQPPAPLRLAGGRPQHRDTACAAVGNLDPDTPRVITVTVTRPPGTAEPLCRTLLVTSSLASSTATSACP